MEIHTSRDTPAQPDSPRLSEVQDLIAEAKITSMVSFDEAPLSLSEHSLAGISNEAVSDFVSILRDRVLEGDDHKLMESLSKFAGQVVVDLGAGQWGYGYQVAAKLGASGYVAVEPFHFPHLLGGLLDFVKDTPTCRAALAPVGMLEALQAFPDRSVSILASGIDSLVVSDFGYLEDTSREISRVLHPHGICFLDCCDIPAPPALSATPLVVESPEFQRAVVYQVPDSR